jgi:hypothetical protein
VTYDIALTENKDGGLLVHRADCRQARTMAALGMMVCTMLGCEQLPNELEFPRHDCLQVQKKPRRAKRRG